MSATVGDKPETVGVLIQQTDEYPDYVKAVNAAEDLETALWLADKTLRDPGTKSALQNMQKATLDSHQAKLASDQASRESKIAQIAQQWAGGTPASQPGAVGQALKAVQAVHAEEAARNAVRDASLNYTPVQQKVNGDLTNLETQVIKSNALIDKLQVYNTERQRGLRKGAGKLRRHAGKQCKASQ